MRKNTVKSLELLILPQNSLKLRKLPQYILQMLGKEAVQIPEQKSTGALNFI